MPIRPDENREMDGASRRTFRKDGKAIDTIVNNGLGKRNLIDNAQFAICQRPTTTVTMGLGGAPARIADRWYYSKVAGAGTTVLGYTPHESFGVALPANRPIPTNIMYVQQTVVAGAPAANDFLQLVYITEGLRVQHLEFGRPDATVKDGSAKSLILTFDCYSSQTATYGVELLVSDGVTTRQISRLFTTSGAGWQTLTIPFPGDNGTVRIPNDTAGRFQVNWNVIMGSTYSGGASLNTVWQNKVDNQRGVGMTNTFCNTLNATFAVTNVQLEIGTTPTPLEMRSYVEELAICQRYLLQLNNAGTQEAQHRCHYAVANYCEAVFPTPVTMRGVPTPIGTIGVDYDAMGPFTGVALPGLAFNQLRLGSGGILMAITHTGGAVDASQRALTGNFFFSAEL